ncbi:MAG: GNAT family N-acetyltransferase [Gemmatimonadaceae bacterium]|nr:GNAT family N-acetyltransferase [Gemmatimonadaceae bacterium]
MRPPPDVALRAATPSDAAAVAALLTELGHQTTAASVAERLPTVLAEGGGVILACVEGGTPVAVMCLARLVVLHAGGSVAYITALITTKRWQGHGIGRMLVRAAFEWAEEQGCARLSVTSAEHRADAHAFYPRCGLPYTGRRFAAALTRAEHT